MKTGVQVMRTAADHLKHVHLELGGKNPLLVMPDDTPAHPYQTSVDIAALAPKAQSTVFPWREPKDLLEKTIDQVRAMPPRASPGRRFFRTGRGGAIAVAVGSAIVLALLAIVSLLPVFLLLAVLANRRLRGINVFRTMMSSMLSRCDAGV